MYDLPDHKCFDVLRGRQVELLCFAPYAVTLHFGEGIHLQIEGAFEHSIAGHARPTKMSLPLSSSQLMRLLAQPVVEVGAERNSTLRLRFANDDVLKIYGNVGPYESYQLQVPGRDLVVV
jgi:hypothetical protein